MGPGVADLTQRSTIADVARTAGVSIATVDRVLNRRPGVRGITVERVTQAVEALGYRPDPYASRLARGVSYRFAIILPMGHNVFMQALAEQAERMAATLLAPRGQVSLHRVDVFDPAALSEATLRLGLAHDGLAMIALDAPPVHAAIDAVTEAGKPVITLVSDAPASRRWHFVGIDNTAAGRTAGALMGRFLGSGRHGPVALVLGSEALRDHRERAAGFRAVLEAEYPGLALLPAIIGRDQDELSRQQVSALLGRTPDLAGLYNVGAGLPGVVQALAEAGRSRDVVLIGHELTAASRIALEAGSLAAVLHQDPGHEIRSALRLLMAAVSGDPIIAEQERIGIDIFIRENLP
jgi:LacI family transcriptional regulator